MKEYAEKSLEELRVEDYGANRKGVQPASSGLFGGTNQSFFGSNQTSTSTGGFTGFGQQSTAQPIFGAANTSTLGQTSAFGNTNSAFNQPAGGGLFGKPLQTPATSASTFGGFGSQTSTFGVAKPFNATAPTTNLFGQTPAATGFGQPATNTFGSTAFGQPQQQQQAPSLFGASSTAPPAWNAGTSTATTGFNTNAGSSLFGASAAAKPAFGTGAFGSTPNAFGATAAPASSGFNFGQSNTSGNLFGQKPATNMFGQPAAQQNTSLPFGASTGSSLFGGSTQPTGGLFGSTPAQNTQNTGGGLFGSSNPGGFGSNLGGMGMSFGQNQPSMFNS